MGWVSCADDSFTGLSCGVPARCRRPPRMQRITTTQRTGLHHVRVIRNTILSKMNIGPGVIHTQADGNI